MRSWRMNLTSEAALWLIVLFLSLEEISGTTTLPGIYGNNIPKSRRTWCEQTNACARCDGRRRPKCSGSNEPVLGADLCECCFSCVAVRDSGESCGSQLSIRPDILGSDPGSSSVTILATTWCREGLVCVNSVCLDSAEHFSSATSPWSGIDQEFMESENDHHALDVSGEDVISIDAELYERTDPPSWEPMFVNQDDPNFRKSDSSTLITSTESSTPFMTESIKKPEPCYAESEEMLTISSYPSDDLLGQVSTMNLNNKQIQLVYTGDLRSELEVLLNAVDTCHEDSLLGEKTGNSLVDGSWESIPYDGDRGDGRSSDSEDYVEVITPSEETVTFSNPYNPIFPVPREKREFERTEDDMVGFDAPVNIREILIRGASAHREYAAEARNHDQNTSALNKSANTMSGEASSQEDESTVRVHITNSPGKVQTLIDLEEDEKDAEINDGERRSLQLANRGRAEDARRLSPLATEQNGVSSGVPNPLGDTVTTERNAVTKKTAESQPTDIPRSVNSPWNDTLMTFNDRLTLLELRIGVFERVLEEIAKWCNLGVFSMTRDCLLAQNSDIRYGRLGPDPDEHLAVASGIDAVRMRGNGRRFNDNVPRGDGFHDTKIPDVAELDGMVVPRQMAHRRRNEPINRNFFRTIIDNGSSRRPPNAGRRKPRRRAQPPCKNHANRGSSWRQPTAEAIVDLPVHRNVQRSIFSSQNFSPKNSSGLDRPKIVDQTASVNQYGNLPLRTLQETQIPGPATLAKKVMTLQDLEKRELSPHEDVFPRELASTAEITTPGSIPAWEMFLLDDEEENDKERSLFPRMKSGRRRLVVQEKSIGRTKRSVKHGDRILPPYEKLRKIRAASSMSANKRGEKLFERETAAMKELGPKINRNRWREEMIAENGETRRVAGPLIVKGNREFRNLPEPIVNRLLFRNSNLPQTTGSTATVISMISQDDQKLPGNSTIQIEEISKNEYEDSLPRILGSSTSEDDFDHIYEAVEAEDEGEDFAYDVPYDQVEYVDGSSVEIVTEVPDGGLEEPKIESKSEFQISKDRIHSVLFPRERNRRAPKNEGNHCKSARRAKREMPLLLFGSTGKHEPKTIVWPSKWIGYRRDRVGGTTGFKNQENIPNTGSWETAGTLEDTTRPNLLKRTTESPNITAHSDKDGETINYVEAPKISGHDCRARKNGRQIILR